MHPKLLKETRPDIIFHLGRPTFPRFRKPGRIAAGIYGQYLNKAFLKRISEATPNSRVIYLSGSLMYGESLPGHPHDEDAPLRPISFARHYFRTEKPLVAAKQSLDIRLIRVPWILGEGSWFAWVYAAHFRKTGKVPLFGKGDNLMHFIFRKDLSPLLFEYALHSTHRTNNLFSPVVLTQAAFANKLARLLNAQVDRVSHNKYEKAIHEAFTSNIELATCHPEILNGFSFSDFDAGLMQLAAKMF